MKTLFEKVKKWWPHMTFNWPLHDFGCELYVLYLSLSYECWMFYLGHGRLIWLIFTRICKKIKRKKIKLQSQIFFNWEIAIDNVYLYKSEKLQYVFIFIKVWEKFIIYNFFLFLLFECWVVLKITMIFWITQLNNGQFYNT